MVKMSGYLNNIDVVKECVYPTRAHGSKVGGHRFTVLEVHGVIDTKDKLDWFCKDILGRMHPKIWLKEEE